MIQIRTYTEETRFACKPDAFVASVDLVIWPATKANTKRPERIR